MILMMFCSFVSIGLVVLLKIVSMLISEKSMLQREEMSSYECGFEHHNVSRIPFSLRYFFLTLIFLLFDLEIVFLFFLPSVLLVFNMWFVLLLVIIFILILFGGLLYEWNDGALEWVN